MTLAKLLEIRRVKQVPLAKRLGVTQATVSRWVSEKVLPSPKTVPLLGAVLKTRVDRDEYVKGRLRFKAS